MQLDEHLVSAQLGQRVSLQVVDQGQLLIRRGRQLLKCLLNPPSSDPVPQFSDQTLQLGLITIEADLDLWRERIGGVLGNMGQEDTSVRVDRDEQG